MTLIVIGTGLAGFGSTVILLRLGVSSMPVRYAVAVLVAYAVFLLFVRLWAEYQRRHFEQDVGVGDPVAGQDVTGGEAAEAVSIYGGGSFGGGGAGRALETSPPESAPAGAASEAPGIGIDLDDAWIVVVPALVILAGLLAAIWIIYTSPLVLAEVLVDVVLVSGLYHRLQRSEPRFWLATAVRQTWLPFAATVLAFAAGGLALQLLVPHADSIGDVLKVMTGREFE